MATTDSQTLIARPRPRSELGRRTRHGFSRAGIVDREMLVALATTERDLRDACKNVVVVDLATGFSHNIFNGKHRHSLELGKLRRPRDENEKYTQSSKHTVSQCRCSVLTGYRSCASPNTGMASVHTNADYLRSLIVKDLKSNSQTAAGQAQSRRKRRRRPPRNPDYHVRRACISTVVVHVYTPGQHSPTAGLSNR